ncbi:hypothetical protein FE257_001433 [Aspergillus nanangensis]|uniref:Transcription factor domain-containing protein n=1 Tax=Aspergillus nanangensis TaxID=2582783 RepID=A0AAD4CDS2_ASPNN|nr:hypothetical protein FE257_001433 [Aspergillus nanangensis]
MDSLPSRFQSPLSMAVAALLVLVPRDSVSYGSPAGSAAPARRTVAQLYAQSALQLIDEDIGVYGSTPSGCASSHLDRPYPRSPLHRDLPVDIEGLIALLLLSVYEYCQRGNLSKMRARTNQALLQAMDMGLHCIPEEVDGFQESKRRAWWWTIHLLYLTSTLQILPPHILLGDSRITTPYPSYHVSPEPWKLYMESQDTYLDIARFVKDLESQYPSPESVPLSSRHEIDRFDSKLRSMMTESNSFVGPDLQDSIEAHAARNIWNYTRSTLNSARLRLYRFIAFSKRPIFLWRHCDLPALNQPPSGDEPMTHSVGSTALTTDDHIHNAEDLTNEAVHASKACLKSALAFTRSFSAICSPDNCADGTILRPRPLPSFACCAMQASYTLLILLYTLEHAVASGNCVRYRELIYDPEPGTERNGLERLIQELRDNVTRMLHTMDNCFSTFEGVMAMPEDVRNAFQYIGASGE